MPKKAKAKSAAKSKPKPNVKVTTPVQVRWLQTRHVADVLSIEAELVAPLDEDELVRMARHEDCITMVAVDGDDRVAGYMAYHLLGKRLHVVRFAVGKRYRRLGVGKQLIEKLKSKLSADRRTSISIEVRESNLDLLLFLRAQRFRAVKVLRERFVDTREDAYLLRYALGDLSAIVAAR